jgi:restriction system protein
VRQFWENGGAVKAPAKTGMLKKDGSLILVQCKQWKTTKVGVNIVRELFGVMTAKRATSGILITSGVFTQEARNFGVDKPIDLVDGTRLLQLIDNVGNRDVGSKTTFE